jgi:hypothetical protein
VIYDLRDVHLLAKREHKRMVMEAHLLVEAVRMWANADCGATQAETLLSRLAEFDKARVGL